jgi:hypothetical protein
MRLRDLLGSELVVVGGGSLGRIRDVRLVQDGPLLGSFGAALRIGGLLAGPASVGVRFGYTRGHMDAPALIAAVLRARGPLLFTPWDDVIAITENVVHVRAGTSLSEPPATYSGRVYDAAFEILDRQLVDVRGRLAGKVDDLGFRFSEASAYCDTIHSGPGAILQHVGGTLGRWLAAAYPRLRDGRDEPAMLSFGVVTAIGPQLTLAIDRDDLDVMTLETWTRDHLISKIPGA